MRQLFPMLLLLGSSAVPALQPNAPSAGLPVTVEGASPLQQGTLVADGIVSYDNLAGSGDDDLVTLRPRLRYGASPNLELALAAPYRLGSAPADDSGTVNLGAQYQVTKKGAPGPVTSLIGAVSRGYGEDKDYTETTLGLAATQPLGTDSRALKLHANLSWLHTFDADEALDEDRYQLVLGASKGLSPRLAVVGDVVRRQVAEDEDPHDLIEVGARYTLGKNTLVALGVGAGLGSEAPDATVNLGIAQAF